MMMSPAFRWKEFLKAMLKNIIYFANWHNKTGMLQLCI